MSFILCVKTLYEFDINHKAIEIRVWISIDLHVNFKFLYFDSVDSELISSFRELMMFCFVFLRRKKIMIMDNNSIYPR